MLAWLVGSPLEVLAMIELHGARTGNGYRAAIALEEAGLPYGACPVDLLRPREPGYLALNPTGRIPTLVDREKEPPVVVTQTVAIVLYAARRSGRLLPDGEAQSARALEWMMAFTTDVIAPSSAAFLMGRLLGPSSADAAAWLTRRAVDHLRWADAALEDGPYLAGEEFSVADVVAFPIVAALVGADLARWPAMGRWFERVGARPAVRRGMAAFDEAPLGTARQTVQST